MWKASNSVWHTLIQVLSPKDIAEFLCGNFFLPSNFVSKFYLLKTTVWGKSCSWEVSLPVAWYVVINKIACGMFLDAGYLKKFLLGTGLS